MRIHPEGYQTLSLAFVALALINVLLYFVGLWCLSGLILLASFIFYGFLLWFFRHPQRQVPNLPNGIISPADGKVVVIEETYEQEYLKAECRQISIFMSPLDVHANQSPVAGKVLYYRYHPGKYLVAWHPKSSQENERNTIVVETAQHTKILFRQIAGAVARRICCALQEGQSLEQGEEFGFIKFGSRVDVFLPLSAEIKVSIGDRVRAGESLLGFLQAPEN